MLHSKIDFENRLNSKLSMSRIFCIIVATSCGVGLVVQTQLSNWFLSPVTFVLLVGLCSSISIFLFVEYLWRTVMLKFAETTMRLHLYADEKLPQDN